MNLDNSGHSLHSSGRDSGLDLSRERSESPSRLQQAQAAAMADQQVVRLRDRRQDRKGKCQCGHNELNVCSGEESSDSYEDSLKNCQLPRRTSLPKTHTFRRSLNNPIPGSALGRGVRHSFSGESQSRKHLALFTKKNEKFLLIFHSKGLKIKKKPIQFNNKLG